MTARKRSRTLPTLAECETALGEKARTWESRCYEISCAIVKAGLVDGVAVYGHWVGNVHTKSPFYARWHATRFVQHGWILLADEQVMDPTRWVFEHVKPYLFVGDEPGVDTCVTCDLLEEEHGEKGPDDHCDNFAAKRWPYDEGGNQWREEMLVGRPAPSAEGPRVRARLRGKAAAMARGALNDSDVSTLASNQRFYLANLPYVAMMKAIGPAGIRMIYNAIADAGDIAYIPCDNADRARRECKFNRE